jgi:hypothetical protein
VVEGVPRFPQYAYSRRVLYIDQDTFRIPYSDIYDPAGQLWKVWISSFLFAKAPIADARYKLEYEVPYEPSITMVDMQKQRATSCELPSRNFPDEQGWYVNVGENEGTMDSWFSLSATLGGR